MVVIFQLTKIHGNAPSLQDKTQVDGNVTPKKTQTLEQAVRAQLGAISPALANNQNIEFLMGLKDPMQAIEEFKKTGSNLSLLVIDYAAFHPEAFEFVVRFHDKLNYDMLRFHFLLNPNIGICKTLNENPEAAGILLDGMAYKHEWARYVVRNKNVLGHFVRNPKEFVEYYYWLKTDKAGEMDYHSGIHQPSGGELFIRMCGLDANKDASMRELVLQAMSYGGDPWEISRVNAVLDYDGHYRPISVTETMSRELNQIWEDNNKVVETIAKLGEYEVLGLLSDEKSQVSPRIFARLFDRLRSIIDEKGMTLTQYLGLGERQVTVHIPLISKGEQEYHDIDTFEPTLGDISLPFIQTFLLRSLSYGQLFYNKKPMIEESEKHAVANVIFQPLLEEGFDPDYALRVGNAIKAIKKDKLLTELMFKKIEEGTYRSHGAETLYFLDQLGIALVDGPYPSIFDPSSIVSGGKKTFCMVYDQRDTELNFEDDRKKLIAVYRAQPKTGNDGELIFEDENSRFVLHRSDPQGNAAFAGKFKASYPNFLLGIRGHAGTETANVDPKSLSGGGNIFLLLGYCWGANTTLDYLTGAPDTNFQFSSYYVQGRAKVTQALDVAFIAAARKPAPATPLEDIVLANRKAIKNGGMEPEDIKTDITGEVIVAAVWKKFLPHKKFEKMQVPEKQPLFADMDQELKFTEPGKPSYADNDKWEKEVIDWSKKDFPDFPNNNINTLKERRGRDHMDAFTILH